MGVSSTKMMQRPILVELVGVRLLENGCRKVTGILSLLAVVLLVWGIR
jgi:hypothetical protein